MQNQYVTNDLTPQTKHGDIKCGLNFISSFFNAKFKQFPQYKKYDQILKCLHKKQIPKPTLHIFWRFSSLHLALAPQDPYSHSCNIKVSERVGF